MATEFISNSWLMPQNSNQDRVSNYSLNFDGSSEYISIASSGALDTFHQNPFSISFWFKTSSGSVQVLADKSNTSSGSTRAFYIYMQSGVIYWYGATASPSYANGSYSDGNWHHAVFVAESDTVAKIYVDGVDDTNNTAKDRIGGLTVVAPIILGTNFNTSNFFLNGKITEVSIFDYALTSANVTSIYGTGSAIGNPMSLSTKPIAYYPLGNSAFNGEFLATNNATELFENYALDFDGSNDYVTFDSNNFGDSSFSVSIWFNQDSGTGYQTLIAGSGYSGGNGFGVFTAGNKIQVWVAVSGSSTKILESASSSVVFGTWHNVVVKREYNVGWSLYLDNSEVDTETSSILTDDLKSANSNFGKHYNSTSYFNGKLSNISIYNTNLSATQITTLYNSGKPFDLNTFAVAPVAWWRLGGVNSSFDGTNWTVLDEIGTNNGTSANMDQSALVDGVGATGNGVSSGMSSGTNRSDAPYSSSNSVSYNMSVTAKSTSIPT